MEKKRKKEEEESLVRSYGGQFYHIYVSCLTL